MKFIIGYFSVIGIIMMPIMVPWGGRLLALFYLYFLWQRWNNPKLVLLMGISAFLSYFIFGIIFAFTFPLWIAIGVVALLYGYSIGLFRKEVTGAISNGADNNNPILPKISLKRKILSGVALVVALLGIIWVTNYGLNTRPCEYTQCNITTPPVLVGEKIILKESAYFVQGKAPDFCEWSESQILNEIIHSENISNLTIGKKYYESQGRTVQKLKQGKIFQLQGVISSTRHGLASIFDSDPSYFLLLQDELGRNYRVSFVYLGYDEKDAIFRFDEDSKDHGLLTWKFLRKYYQ